LQAKTLRASGMDNPSPFVVSLFNPHLQLLSTGTPIETEWKLGQNHTNDNPFTKPSTNENNFLDTKNLNIPLALPALRSFNEGGSNHANTQNPTTVHQLNLTNEYLSQDNNITAFKSSPYRLIGQYNSTYLLIEKEDGLFLVDQHAAHERILYELFSERFNEVITINLLFPQIITLSTQDMTVINPHLDIFTNNGIIIEQCASDQLVVQSIPIQLKEQSLIDIIGETISLITENALVDEISLKKTLNNKLQAQMACKAAVKAGDILTLEQMIQLLRDLEKTANRFSCPHGRPTGWLLSLHDIEKKFKRRI
jgi:DNA mismatch repair protein MutL